MDGFRHNVIFPGSEAPAGIEVTRIEPKIIDPFTALWSAIEGGGMRFCLVGKALAKAGN
jgi:hypothetical protein